MVAASSRRPIVTAQEPAPGVGRHRARAPAASSSGPRSRKPLLSESPQDCALPRALRV